MIDTARIPFDAWRTGDGLIAYTRGYEMGARHATTGDPRDFSDDRCAPLTDEREAAATDYKGKVRGAFYGGYQHGYESQLPNDFWKGV